MANSLENQWGQTELSPVFPGQAPCYLGLTCGERPLAHSGLTTMGDPEDDEEEEEEEKKKREEDEDEEDDDGADDVEPLKVNS